MSTGLLAPSPVQQFSNALGQPLAGAQLFTYLTGTSTPSPIYTDAACLHPWPNPAIANAAGELTIYMPAVIQKWMLYDALGNLQWTVDPVQSTDLLTTDQIAQVLLSVPTTGGLSTYIGATLTGAINNWVPGLAGNTVIEWTGTGAVTYSGLAGGVAGQVVTFKNNGTAVALFLNQSGLSTAGNKFLNIVTLAGTPVAPGGSISYFYDGTQWVVTAHEQGQWITPTFSAGNYVASSAGTWTVGAVTTGAYYLKGTTLSVKFDITLTTVAQSGAQPTALLIAAAAYGGFTSTAIWSQPCLYNDNAGGILAGLVQSPSAGSPFIAIEKLTAAQWSASTTATSVYVGVSFQVT